MEITGKVLTEWVLVWDEGDYAACSTFDSREEAEVSARDSVFGSSPWAVYRRILGPIRNERP